MRPTLFTALALGGMIIAGQGAFVAARAADKAELVDVRQQEMKKLGGAMKATSEFAKGGGSAADVGSAAATIIEVGGKMPTLWVEGTAMGVGDSEALPSIWEQPAKVAELTQAMIVEGTKLSAIAAAGDRAAIGAQLGAIGKTCKGCHDGFKKPK